MNIISMYIERLTREDIVNFINKNNYIVNNTEIDTIYYYIKNKYIELIHEDKNTWNNLQNQLSDNTYLLISNLFNKYKKYL